MYHFHRTKSWYQNQKSTECITTSCQKWKGKLFIFIKVYHLCFFRYLLVCTCKQCSLWIFHTYHEFRSIELNYCFLTPHPKQYVYYIYIMAVILFLLKSSGNNITYFQGHKSDWERNYRIKSAQSRNNVSLHWRCL